MSDQKQWYLSRTIWGSLIALAAALASLMGVDINADTQNIILEAILQMTTILASIYAVFGRLRARHEIG